MTRNLEHDAGLSAPDAKVLADIQSYGWHVTKVFRSGTEPGPEWAFSIGLFHSYCHPEVVIFGLKLDVCLALVNEIGRQVKAGKKYDVDREYGDILSDPYNVCFDSCSRATIASIWDMRAGSTKAIHSQCCNAFGPTRPESFHGTKGVFRLSVTPNRCSSFPEPRRTLGASAFCVIGNEPTKQTRALVFQAEDADFV